MKRKLILIAVAAALSGCEDYFGSKTDLDFIEVPNYGIREIAYVPIQPAFTGFVRPTDICVGFDELLYVVDAGTEEIICLNESGAEQGRFTVPGVKSVRQDRRLDLIAIGTHDSTINGVAYTLPAIYRIKQTSGNDYGLDHARISNKIVHPFYFKSTFSTGDANAEFGQIGILASANPSLNNRFYVTRRGSISNNANQGPDQAVVLFDAQDQYLSPVSVTTAAGLFTNYFKQPQGLVSFAQPPQFTAKAGDDFWFTSLDENQEIRVQQINLVETPFGADFKPGVALPNPDRADRWIGQPGLFERPMGMTMAGDQNRYLFVVDEAKDSLFQFTANGLEGIPPPPASGATRFAKVSFGGTGTGPMQFNGPVAVGYWRSILYVVDAGNGRVSRFKNTLDFE